MKFQIEESAAAVGAEDRFFQICAFDLAEDGQRKMEKAAFEVRRHLQEKMDIRAAVCFWNQPVLDCERLCLGDIFLTCAAFSQIPAEAVKGAFVYLLTIGETDVEAEGSIMTELYHDIWGTAYVESAVEVLREDCLMPLLEEGGYLSESFGPGYYGMDMGESQKLFGLLSGVSIGVIQKESTLLVPEKSCLGLILVYDRNDIRLPHVCEKCLGNQSGCRFCEKMQGK